MNCLLHTAASVIFFLVVAVAFQSGAAANAQELQVNEQVRYVDFTGRDLRTVILRMKSHSRKQRDGQTFYAETQSEYRVAFEPTNMESGCVLDSYKVVLDIEYRMPRWKNKKNAPELDRFQWNTNYRRIWRHERVHGEIAKAAGSEILSIIADIKSTESCTLLVESAAAAVRRFLDISTAQDEFDKYARKRKDATDFDIAAAVRRDREKFNLAGNSDNDDGSD